MTPENQSKRWINGRRHYVVDRIACVVAIALAVPTGWWLVEELIAPESPFWLAAAAVAAPVLILVFATSTEFLRFRIANRQALGPFRRLVGPLGSVGSTFVIRDTAGTELRREVAIVGVQLLFGAVLLTPALIAGNTLDELTPWMIPGIVAVGFALVNTVPALPMSGGHMLRAIFWFLHDDQTIGTRAAFLYSQLVASASFGFGGFFLIWRPSLLIPALWCLLIGVLTLRASRHEVRRALIIERASTIRAADALAGLNPTIRASAPMTEAIDILLEQHANGPALVRDRNVYIGMLTLERARSIPRREWNTREARELVTPFDQLSDSLPGEDLLGVLQRLDQSEPSAVIVRETSGAIVGLVDHSMDARRLMRRGLGRTISGTVPVNANRDDRQNS